MRPSSVCSRCRLVFVHAEYHISRDAEYERYKLHHNSIEDSGYLIFLEQIIAPFVARVCIGSNIIDFGSGPTPVMAEILEKRGFVVATYDPFFSPDIRTITRTYDAVVCCEAAEHFREPMIDWSKMTACIGKGGIIALMTLRYNNVTDLNGWWYVQDPTHICFYSQTTLEWISSHFGFELELISERVAFLTKK